MKLAKARTFHEIRGVKFEVEGKSLVCPKCGFQTVPAELIDEHAKLVDQAYRRAAGLLSAAEIRMARQKLHFSQQEFAEYLGVGEASIKRWELGALQDKSSDNLIHLMTDPDHAKRKLDELCRRLGRKEPAAPSSVVAFVTVSGGERKRYAWHPAVRVAGSADTPRVCFPAARN